MDNDIGWYDFALRSYDAQLGRFWQSDPYDQFSSPFTGMGNDPLNMTDPSGGWVNGVAEMMCGEAIRTMSNGLKLLGLTSFLNLTSFVANSISNSTNSEYVTRAISGIQMLDNSLQMDNNGGDPDNNKNSGNPESSGFFTKLWRSYQRLDRWVGEHGGDWINENLNPVTPFVELIFGKAYSKGNFSQDKPRSQSAQEAVIVLIPGGKLVGTGEKIFIKGVGNISKNYFHKTIKEKILKAARGKFEHIVGGNPDIIVEGEKIVLKGVYESFKGKTFETTLKAIDFFK